MKQWASQEEVHLLFLFKGVTGSSGPLTEVEPMEEEEVQMAEELQLNGWSDCS